MAAGNALPLPSTVGTNQRQPGWISGRRLHSNVCFQCGIFGQGCHIKSMVAQALLSRHQKMTQISTITARFRHHPKPPVAPPLLHSRLIPYKKQQPISGPPPHCASAPPLRCRRSSPCPCCSAERLPLQRHAGNIGGSAIRVVYDDLDEPRQRRRVVGCRKGLLNFRLLRGELED